MVALQQDESPSSEVPRRQQKAMAIDGLGTFMNEAGAESGFCESVSRTLTHLHTAIEREAQRDQFCFPKLGGESMGRKAGGQ